MLTDADITGDCEPPRLAMTLRAEVLASDAFLDRLYPAPIRDLSAQYWTSVEVATRAARYLASASNSRVLDVGAGAGKFCIVGALVSNAHFTGIEQRPHLVAAGCQVAAKLRARRVRLVVRTVEQVRWSDHDAFYFFNPFEENLVGTSQRIDSTVRLSAERYRADVDLVERALARARPGTRVATYNGFGGAMPGSYRLVEEHGIGLADLQFWIQAGVHAPVRRAAQTAGPSAA